MTPIVFWVFLLLVFAAGVWVGRTWVILGRALVWVKVVHDDEAWEARCREMRRQIIEIVPPCFRGR